MKIAKFFKKYSAPILSIIGAAGVAVTAVAASKAALKADELVKEAAHENDSELTKADIFKIAIPAYIPVIATGTATICCILGANMLNKRQQAMLTSAYAVVSKAYGDYKNKVREVYGEDAHRDILEQIRSNVQVEQSDPKPIYASTFFSACCLDFESSEEERLFYDAFSERYFQSTFSKVLQAEYHLNRNYVLGMEVTLNNFYELLGIDQTDYGERIGWNIDNGMMWIDFDHYKIILDDGLECFMIEMMIDPVPND